LISLPCILVNTKYLSFAILKNIFFIYVHYAAFKVQEASPLTTGYCRFLKSSSFALWILCQPCFFPGAEEMSRLGFCPVLLEASP